MSPLFSPPQLHPQEQEPVSGGEQSFFGLKFVGLVKRKETVHITDPDIFKQLCDHVTDAVFQAIVFVVGGGNYIEYQNLADYAKVLRHP